MNRLKNGMVELTVLEEFGGSLGMFASTVVDGKTYVNVFQNSGDEPNLGNLAFFPMAPWPGRLRDCDAGPWGIFKHPHEHALHAVLRRTKLWVVEVNKTMVKLEGILESSPEMTVVSRLKVEVEVTLLADGFEYYLRVTNIGDVPSPILIGLHAMCYKDPWGTGEQVEIEYKATKWWPPADDLAVPAGPLEDLPEGLDRSKGGVMGPNWDHCLTGLKSQRVEVTFPVSSVLLELEDVLGNCSALQTWHAEETDAKTPQVLCAPEFQEGVADSFRHDGDPNFPYNVRQPGEYSETRQRVRLTFMMGG